jgi:signal transduction histidine kinase
MREMNKSVENSAGWSLATYFSTVLKLISIILTVVITTFTVLLYQELTQEDIASSGSSRQLFRQAGSEIFKLQRGLERYALGVESKEDLYLYYDILYSRMKTFQTNKVISFFDLNRLEVENLIREIFELETTLDRISSPQSDVILQFRQHLNDIQAKWENIALFQEQSRSDELVAQQEHHIWLTKLIGFSLLTLILSVSGILVFLGRQMHLRHEALVREKSLSAELVKSTQIAEAASHTKTVFLSMMSHELRTPLNAISGFSHLLAQSSLDEKQKSYIRFVQQASGKLNDLISNILIFVEIESDGRDYILKSVEVAAITSDFEEFLARQVKEEDKDISITIKCLDGVPQKIVTQPSEISRILNIIGLNAIRYSQTDRIQIELSVDHKIGQDYLHISIKDFGVGISEESQAVLFEVFGETDAQLAHSYDGSALGLAICRKIIERLHGFVGVESVEGEGSTFWVQLPILK